MAKLIEVFKLKEDIYSQYEKSMGSSEDQEPGSIMPSPSKADWTEIKKRHPVTIPKGTEVALLAAIEAYAEHSKNTYKTQSIEGDYEEFTFATLAAMKKQAGKSSLSLTQTEIDVLWIAIQAALGEVEFGFGPGEVNWSEETGHKLSDASAQAAFKALEKVFGKDKAKRLAPENGSLIDFFQ